MCELHQAGSGGKAAAASPGLEAGRAHVFLPVDEFRDVIRQVVVEALRERESSTPLTVTRPGLARVLGCSLASVDALRKRGAPEIRLADSPRFVVADVLAWLREERKGP